MADAAAGGGAAAPAPFAPFEKQVMPTGRKGRTASVSGLNPENACKWRALNRLYEPKNKEWQAAADAASWNAASIVTRIRRYLDSAWAIEQANAARASAERAKEEQRQIAIQERNADRRNAAKPIRQFLAKKGMVMVHEPDVIKPPSALAVANPLSQEYSGRHRKPKRKEPSPSPSPEPGLEEEAAKLGIKVVAKHKDKRQRVGASAAKEAEEAEAEAEAALKALPPGAAQRLLNKMVPTPKKKPAPKEPKRKVDAAQQQTARDKAAYDLYYKKKLKEINEQRATKGKGKLNKAGRADLFTQCGFHYKDPPHAEGFGGSALVSPWYAKYRNDFVKYPSAAEDETDSEAD